MDKIYKVKNYYYVGGNSGKTTEREMMIEIINKGPIVCNILTTPELRYYKGGIFEAVDKNSY